MMVNGSKKIIFLMIINDTYSIIKLYIFFFEFFKEQEIEWENPLRIKQNNGE